MSSPWDYFGETAPEAAFAPPPGSTPALDRKSFADAMADPATKRALLANVHAEVGDQFKTNPAVAQAKLETILNRAAARRMTPLQAATDPKYYPAVTLQRMQKYNDDHLTPYSKIYADVAAGSNVSNYATGNASGTVGFAGGPKTYQAPGTYERFGIEGPDRKWAASAGASVQQQPTQGTKMGDWVSPFQDNQMMSMTSNQNITGPRTRLANADGTVGPDYADGQITPAMIAKYLPKMNPDDVESLAGVHNLQQALTSGVLKKPEMNMWDALSMGLGGLSAGLHARSGYRGAGELAQNAVGNIGKSFRDATDQWNKTNTQAALQRAGLLGRDIDAAIKAQAEQKREREQTAAYLAARRGASPPQPSGSVPQAPPAPQIGPPGATSGVPGTVLAEPAPAAVAAPTTAQPMQQQPSPQVMPMTPEEKAYRDQADLAIAHKRPSAEVERFHKMADAVRAEVAKAQEKTNSIQEYEYDRAQHMARGEKPDAMPTFSEWSKGRRAGGVRFGLTPIPVENADGSIGYVVPSTAGEAKALQMPDGSRIKPKINVIDTPTEKLFVDTLGNVVKREPKDVAGKEEQEKVGQARGQAVVDLPKVDLQRKKVFEYLDAVEKDPNLPNVLGYNAWTPTLRPESRDTENRLRQIEGKAFEQAFQSLKGAGAITEVEGQAATQALARLKDLKQSEPGYRAALADFRREIDDLYKLAHEKAKGGRTSVATPTAPRRDITIERMPD